jgi:uncharacterized protein involved in exopolysaccharide biosynthesis
LTAPHTRFREGERAPSRGGEAGEQRQEGALGRRGPASRRPRDRGLPDWTPIALVALGIVVISVASAVFFGSLGTKTYGARADMLYVAPDNTSDDARERILATQQELIRSRVVLEDVSRSAGISLPALRDAVSVDVGRDDLLHLTVADKDPQRARELAQTIATRYLRLTSRLSPATTAGRRLIQEKIDRLTAGGRPRTAAARGRVARLRDRLVDLEVQNLARGKADLLSPAYVLDDPLSPKPLRSGALGLLIGLLIATVVVVATLRRTATSAR